MTISRSRSRNYSYPSTSRYIRNYIPHKRYQISHADAHQQVHPGPETSSFGRRTVSLARALPLVKDGRTFTSPTAFFGQADQCKPHKLKFGRSLLLAIAEGTAEKQVASFPTSKLVRRIDGYNVLENVLAHDDKLCAYAPPGSPTSTWTHHSHRLISYPRICRYHNRRPINNRPQPDHLPIG